MKKILILFAFFVFAISNAQYKVAIKANSIEVYDNATGNLLNSIKNLTSMYVNNNSGDGLRKYVNFYYSSQTLQLYYDQIQLVSVSEGAYVAPTSFTDFVNDLNTVVVLNPAGGGGGGGGGDASAANQVTANNRLTSIDNKTPAVGQTTSANSSPVVIASNQSPVNTILTSSATAAAAGVKATMTAYGYLRTANEPTVQFADSFDGAIDVVDKWTQVGTVTSTNSAASIGNVLTTSTVHSLTSKPTFPSLGISFQVLAWVGSFETNPLATTNVNRYYGFHTHTGTPTVAVPATNGVGLEWDATTGKLWLAVYQSGVRSPSSVDLSAFVTDANTRYAVLYRSDLVIAYIGSSEIPVASISFVTPDLQNLPVKFQTVIGASTPSTTPLNKISAIAEGDTGGNASQISDGTNPYRKVKVDANGSLLASLSSESSIGVISTQNLVPSGVATANSAVELTLNGTAGLSIQTVGTYTGALSLQVTIDGVNWITVGGTSLLNVNTGGLLSTITSALQGAFQTETGGFLKARITALAAVTGSVTVSIRAIANTPIVSIDSAIPSGSNTIGAVNQTGTWTTQIGNTPNTTPILANPLTPVVGTTGDTGAKTATGNGATQTNTTSKGVLVVLNLGAVTGTTPTGVFKLQGSADSGTTWLDIPGATTASLVATGVYGIEVYPALTPVVGSTTTGTIAIANTVLPRTWRVVWTLGGTTPSYTITNIQVNYIL